MSEANIIDLKNCSRPVRFKEGFGQRYLLTVDTEEDFDWTEPLARTAHRIDSVARLRKFQQFCEGRGVVPVYLMDYPIATSPLAAELLRGAVAEGRAEIGVQLHPWVSPPNEEVINEFNSFAGNLPQHLERAKLMKLHEAILTNFGQPPLIYRAGRYGIGPNTAAILREAGIAIDTSARARFDYSDGGGPNFQDLPILPWWVGEPGSLLELPLTTVYSGLLSKLGPLLFPLTQRLPGLRGFLAQLGLLERIPITPEGVTVEEALRGVDVAVREDLPVLVLSFHSPSLSPGHTPYVRNQGDLDDLYDWWRTIFARLGERGVLPTTVREIMASVELA